MVRRAVAGLLLAALVAGCGGAASRRAVPTTTAPARPAPPPAAAGGVARVGSAALDIGGGATTTVAAVVAPGPTGGPWVVAGTRAHGDGTSTATVWTSPDAGTFTAAALTPPGVTSEAAAACTSSGVTVVVGSVGAGGARRAAVWRSPSPGAPFVQVADQAAFAGPARMQVVAAGALGVVAAGTVGGALAIWYSTDGQHFRRSAGAETVIGATPGATVAALAAAGDGIFAAGSTGTGPSTTAAVWTSSDGIDWTADTQPPGVFSGSGPSEITGLVDVDRFPGRTVLAVGAVDQAGAWQPASWLSPDGRSFGTPSLAFPEPTTTATPAATGLAPAGMVATSVTVAPSGFDAVASDGSANAAWTSTDGRSWSPLALPAAAAAATWRAGAVAVSATTTVIADLDAGNAHLLVDGPAGWAEPTADATTWGSPMPVATPVGLRAGPSGLTLLADVATPPQSLGPVGHRTVVLSSPDGTTWAPLDASAFAADTITAVSPAGDVAVGTTIAGSPAVLTSADGRTWVPLPATAAAPPSPDRPTAAVGGVAGGPAVVVGTGDPPGGSGGAAPLAWVATPSQPLGQPVDLDGADIVGQASPTGACRLPATPGATDGVAAVGVRSLDGAAAPVAWTTDATGSWRPAQITGPSGGAAAVAGCATVAGGLVAWGQSVAAGGLAEPALWSSADGRSWSAQGVAAFDQAAGAGGAPGLAALAAVGSGWLAAGGASTAPSTAPDGAVGLWRSDDGGRSFRRVATTGAGPAAVVRQSLDQAAWLGGVGVVAGDVDGRLAVFTTT